jgi:hypothetical protein
MVCTSGRGSESVVPCLVPGQRGAYGTVRLTASRPQAHPAETPHSPTRGEPPECTRAWADRVLHSSCWPVEPEHRHTQASCCCILPRSPLASPPPAVQTHISNVTGSLWRRCSVYMALRLLPCQQGLPWRKLSRRGETGAFTPRPSRMWSTRSTAAARSTGKKAKGLSLAKHPFPCCRPCHTFLLGHSHAQKEVPLNEHTHSLTRTHSFITHIIVPIH